MTTTLGDSGRVLRQVADVLRLRHSGIRAFTDPVPRVVAYVAEHYACSTVETIAAGVALSSRQLSRVFAEQLRMTVKGYVTRVQIEAAKCLFRETDDKVDAVAERVGLCDAPHLARVFRRHGSGTPGSYRR